MRLKFYRKFNIKRVGNYIFLMKLGVNIIYWWFNLFRCNKDVIFVVKYLGLILYKKELYFFINYWEWMIFFIVNKIKWEKKNEKEKF